MGETQNLTIIETHQRVLLAPSLLRLTDLIFNGESTAAEALLTQIKPEIFQLARPSTRRHEVYGRNILLALGHTEIMLAQWRSHIECAVHDHGHSLGHVIALSGEFVETQFQWTSQNELAPTSKTLIRSPRRMDVHLGDLHSMRCLSPGGLTLHLYRPQISAMRVYDRINRRTLTVSDDCGAWLPLPHQIQSIETWSSRAT